MRLLVPVIAAATVLLLVSCGSGSGAKPAPPTASLTASKAAINTGQEATLTWSSTNATSCTATGGWSGELAASGTQSTGALDNDTDFSLTCTGAGGTSTAATTTVAPIPSAPAGAVDE